MFYLGNRAEIQDQKMAQESPAIGQFNLMLLNRNQLFNAVARLSAQTDRLTTFPKSNNQPYHILLKKAIKKKGYCN